MLPDGRKDDYTGARATTEDCAAKGEFDEESGC